MPEDPACARPIVTRPAAHTHRLFLSANLNTPGVACELFCLDAAPIVAQTRSDA